LILPKISTRPPMTCPLRTVEWVTVRKGQVIGGLVEIFGNIKEGDQVATQGSEELQNQSKVKVASKGD